MVPNLGSVDPTGSVESLLGGPWVYWNLTKLIVYISSEYFQKNKVKVNKEMRVYWEESLCFLSLQPPICHKQSACSHNQTRVVGLEAASSSIQPCYWHCWIYNIHLKLLFWWLLKVICYDWTVCNLILQTILHLKFASICKCRCSFPNYLFNIGHKNVGVRKLDNYLKRIHD